MPSDPSGEPARAGSRKDVVFRDVFAAMAMTFLMGILFMLAVQKSAQHDPAPLWIIPLFGSMLFVACLNVRRILKAVP